MILNIKHINHIETKDKSVIDTKTFYIYKFGYRGDLHNGNFKIDLIIVDGIKTDPLFVDPLNNFRIPTKNEYCIPAGIITTYDTGFVKPDCYIVNDTKLVCTKRNDKYAVEQYKLYLQGRVEQLKNKAQKLIDEGNTLRDTAKQFENYVNDISITVN